MKPRCRKGGGAVKGMGMTSAGGRCGAAGRLARERGCREMSGASLPYCSVMLAARRV